MLPDAVIPRRPRAAPAGRTRRLAAALGLLAGLTLGAAGDLPSAERLAFDAALRVLQDGFAEQAAADLNAFRQQFPASPLAPQAALLAAHAHTQVGQLDHAATLLAGLRGSLGELQVQADYLLGDVHLRRGNFPEAAGAFRQVTGQDPAPPLLLQAGFGEALALFRAGNYIQAAALLATPTQAFPRAAAAAPNDDLALRGRLLLAEAQLRTGASEGALATLASLTNQPLTPTQAWEREWLLATVGLTNRQSDAALAASSNLLSLATATASRDLLARSRALRATVLQQAGRFAEAFTTLTNNLAEGTPDEWRRDAVLALARLPLAPPDIDPALRLLSALATSPEPNPDPTATAARVALAELRLQQYFATTPPVSNALAEARLHLQTVLSNAPPPQLAGRAWLDLGWTSLASTELVQATDAFARAAATLEPSPIRALALFKLADCQHLATNHAAALTNYLRVLREPHGNAPLPGALRERALYQGALAALESGQQHVATELADQAILEFPNGEFRDDTRVLYGQTLARLEPPSRAREVLRQLATRPGISRALPEIQLAAARSHLRERNWSNALHQLDDWTRSYPTHAGIARAQFERAWAAFKNGDESRAYVLYTNFLARFPDDPNAPQAQIWVGDHFLRSGDFVAAESNYQLVFQRTNWPASRLTQEARLMAGRAAFLRQGYTDAKAYFRWIIENGPPAVTNSYVTPGLVAQALFALGDCFIVEPESDDRLSDAMTAFAKLIERLPESREALLAHGRLADCHLQRAALDPPQAAAAYTNAAQLYLHVLQAPQAPIATRSEAELALGVVREKQAAAAGPLQQDLLKEALGHYLHVFHGRNLRPGEEASPFWVSRSGLEAARLAEALGLRPQAAAIFDSLADRFPDAAPAFRDRARLLRTP